MDRRAVLAHLQARPGKASEVAAFVRGYISLVAREPETTAWFGGRSSPSTFAIFGVFPGQRGRASHLAHGEERSSASEAAEILAGPPNIEMADVLAVKLCEDLVTRGLLVSLAVRPGREGAIEELLAGARALVEDETETIAWFALRFGPLRWATMAFFSHDAGRRAHTTGPTAMVLSKAGPLLVQVPRISTLDVLVAKLQREPSPPPAHDSRWMKYSLRLWAEIDDRPAP